MQFAWSYAPPLIIDAALKNGLFDALAKGPLSADELASATNTSARGVRAAMDALVGFGLAARDAQGRYVLSPESAAFLVSSQPGYLGGFFNHMTRDLIPAWLSVGECVRTGRPARHVNTDVEGAKFFHDFVESLFPLSYPVAQGLAHALAFPQSEPVKVLDIAAGSGVWGIGLAEACPLAHVTAVDWDEVLPVTREIVARHKLSEQFSFVAGDILEADYGTDYDVATLGHILHSEGDARSIALLRKVANALKPGGVIAIAEFLVDDDRNGPPQGLIFAVNMLVNTDTGRTFSFAEIKEWLADAGFTNARLLPGPGVSPLILANRMSRK
ncbi:MAG: class I SAM-dependent methyltransferase [Acidobacteriaceae bacterium]|nr:class I SAM-dependent methyltransferase [Acidobacteriaceae bacterium]